MSKEVSEKPDAGADELLAAAIASGESVKDAAAKAGVCDRTVYRRLRDQKFRRRVSRLRTQLVEAAMGRMADGMAEAATTLRTLLKAKSESVKLGACRAMLELGIKLKDFTDHEPRLQELEADLRKREGKSAGRPDEDDDDEE